MPRSRSERPLPPVTSREKTTLLRADNTSGTAGVYRSSGEQTQWVAYLAAGHRVRTKSFSITEHGDATARALAVEQRREWLAGILPSFRTADPHAATKARERFPDRLERMPKDHDDCLLPDAEVGAVLQRIDKRFDAFRPHRVRISMRLDAQGRLRGLVACHADGRTRMRQSQTGTRSRSHREAVASAVAEVERMLGELCGAEPADAVMAKCRDALDGHSSLETMREGVHVTVFLPAVTGAPGR